MQTDSEYDVPCDVACDAYKELFHNEQSLTDAISGTRPGVGLLDEKLDYEFLISVPFGGESLVRSCMENIVVSAPDHENAVETGLGRFAELHPEFATNHDYPECIMLRQI